MKGAQQSFGFTEPVEVARSYVRIVVDLPSDREFDYLLPDQFKATARIGSRVVVPFGPRTTGGYIVGFGENSSRGRLKSVISVEEGRPFITESILKLASWMAKYYCATVEQALRTILPSPVRKDGAGFKHQLFVELVEPAPDKPVKLTDKQKQALEEVKHRKKVLLSDILRSGRITMPPLKALEKHGFVTIEEGKIRRDPLADKTILKTSNLKLMPEQAQALAEIIECTGDAPGSKVVLLHGVTGSGKTEVYLQALDHVLRQGRGAIVLVPEIALTPQTVERFVGRFGDRVAVLHSHLSSGERHDEWHRIRDGKADIVVGARSAVFAPLEKLGLIVVDEEHEPSYKQDEMPRYNARDVAVMRGHIEKCPVVLGSATPALESWYNTRNRKYRLSKLTKRADDCRMPIMRVVDMTVETQKNNGKPAIFSRDLIDAMRLRLDRSEQTMLFLNRRGYATSLLCPQCGFVAKCDHCSVSLTYHRNDELLRCHVCGWFGKVPDKCPACKDPAFKFAGIGTQRIEMIVKKCFPHATIQRMDADVTTCKDAYDRILGDFRTGKIDILIGTQMIAKGLHFPNVTLVGVVYADLSLHMPDFRASERTFQLLAQVAGRAGRGEIPGEVIVQTYTPFDPAIQAARRLDYDGFIDQEIEARKELRYPPHTHLVCLTFKGPSEGKVSYSAITFVRELRPLLAGDVLLSDPTPSPLSRAKGMYRFQVLIRCSTPSRITGPLMTTLNNLKLPGDVTCSVDVDAMSTM